MNISNLQPGQTLGNYTIISELSPLGRLMAFKAYSSQLARDVTLALLPPALSQNNAVRARFPQAAQALLGLRHEHVLAVYDAGEIDGVPYLALQSVEAHTLAERLQTGSLSLTDITRIVSQLADALNDVPSNDVTPGALALDNVLLDEHGNVYLAGLGLSGVLTPADAGSDPRASVYALGSLLSALVSGHEGADASLNEALQRLNDTLPLNRKAEVASAYERVIRQATAANRDERFASLAELLAAWQQVSAPTTVTATANPPTAPPIADAATLRNALAAQSHAVETARQPAEADAKRAAEQAAFNTQQEKERLRQQFEVEEAARATQVLGSPRAPLVPEPVSTVPVDTMQRTRRLITLIAVSAGIVFCGLPTLCFVCIAVLPETPATPTATMVVAATGTATRPPAINATLVFSDNFTAGACHLPEGDNEKRTFKCDNGEYTMLNKVDGSRWAYYDDEYQDSVIEVDAHAVSGPTFIEYGLVFRVASDGKSLYGFALTREGKFTVFRYQNNAFSDLLPYISSSAIRAGTATNRLKVVMQQNRISVYANDQFLSSVSDSNLPKGAVGLFLNSDSPNAKAAFSNLRISTISR